MKWVRSLALPYTLDDVNEESEGRSSTEQPVGRRSSDDPLDLLCPIDNFRKMKRIPMRAYIRPRDRLLSLLYPCTHKHTASPREEESILFASLIPWALITQISAHYALIDSSHHERRETDPPTASRSESNYKGLPRLFLISGNAEGVSDIKVKQRWCGFTHRPTAH